MAAPRIIDVGDLDRGRVAARFEGADYGANVSCFLVDCPPGAGPGPHRHPYEETFVVQAGSGWFTVDGETMEVSAGQIVVVPAGAVHRFEGAGDELLRMVTIHPSARFVQDDL